MLWHQWLISLGAKKIGIMYIVVTFVMLTRALIEAGLMRLQQAVAVNSPGFLSPEHFGELRLILFTGLIVLLMVVGTI